MPPHQYKPGWVRRSRNRSRFDAQPNVCTAAAHNKAHELLSKFVGATGLSGSCLTKRLWYARTIEAPAALVLANALLLAHLILAPTVGAAFAHAFFNEAFVRVVETHRILAALMLDRR